MRACEPISVKIWLTYFREYVIVQTSKRGTAPPPRGGDNVTMQETLSLLNLLAVVIFGVITVTKK